MFPHAEGWHNQRSASLASDGGCRTRGGLRFSRNICGSQRVDFPMYKTSFLDTNAYRVLFSGPCFIKLHWGTRSASAHSPGLFKTKFEEKLDRISYWLHLSSPVNCRCTRTRQSHGARRSSASFRPCVLSPCWPSASPSEPSERH
jgi:hypothetical protein